MSASLWRSCVTFTPAIKIRLDLSKDSSGGAAANSPALQRWEEAANEPVPEGRLPLIPMDFGFGQKFSRAYGTSPYDWPFPSAEALGYWQVSLRDRMLRRNCV